MGALSRAVLLQWEPNLHASKLCGANGHCRSPSLSAGGDALLVSLVCRSVLHHFHFKGCVHSVSFSPDGRYGPCAQDGALWRAGGAYGPGGVTVGACVRQGLVWAGQTVPASSPGSCRAPRAQPLPPPLQPGPAHSGSHGLQIAGLKEPRLGSPSEVGVVWGQVQGRRKGLFPGCSALGRPG